VQGTRCLVRRVGPAALGITVACAVGASAGPAFAVQVSCGQVITVDTKVSNDLEDCANNGLSIGADGVALDLNGHRIDGNGDSTGDGIVIDDGIDAATVRNGTVRQFNDGIAVGTANGDRIINVDVVRNDDDGMDLGNPNDPIVRNSNAIENDSDGFEVGFTSDPVFSGNSTEANGGQGFDFFTVTGGLIEESVARGDVGGFELSDVGTTKVLSSRAVKSEGPGFLVDGASGSTKLRGVRSVRSAGAGIHLAEGSGTKVIASLARRSDLAGIRVEDATTGTLLRRNTANLNQASGIAVLEANTSLARNRANDNALFGIDAVAGVTDLGGNKASGNDAGKCVNVSCT
jgi:parallel beta-helix repeat protein